MKKNRIAAIGLAMVLAGTIPVAAEGFRDIATVSLDYYLDDSSWHLAAENVFLARVVPALTLHTQIAWEQTPDWFAHFYQFGPVINFTESLYLIALYAVGIDSAKTIHHQADLDFNFETAQVATSLGVRAILFPGTEYFYLLPSMSARIRPVEPLGIFGKLFVSMDSDRVVTGSFWGEADYAVARRVALRAGFTLSYAEQTFGWSLIAGSSFKLAERVALRYSFSWFTDTVQYLDQPTARGGVRNALTLDARF